VISMMPVISPRLGVVQPKRRGRGRKYRGLRGMTFCKGDTNASVTMLVEPLAQVGRGSLDVNFGIAWRSANIF
jgi:hypothetical protein